MSESLRTAADRQLRRRSIAMSVEEVDLFLSASRNCYVATSTRDGVPHVSPVWFVWHDSAVWVSSMVRSQRWIDISANPSVSVVFEAGTEYRELRGVRIDGHAQPIGQVPRTLGKDPLVAEPERLLAEKYAGSADTDPDGRHAWLRIEPVKVTSWDFRKLPTPV